MAWLNITDILTPQGIEKLKVGQVLMFDFEGSRNELKIMRKTESSVWAKRISTVLPEQVMVKEPGKKKRRLG